QPSQVTVEFSVDLSGRYEVRLHSPELSYCGDVGRPITNIAEADGQDALGGFHQVDFDHATQSSEIRVYHDLPAVLFTTTYRSGSPNGDAFPMLTSLPTLPYRLTYQAIPFSPSQLNSLV